MLSQIIGKEQLLDSLLPVERLTSGPSLPLRAAASGWSEAVWGAALLSGRMLLTGEEIRQGKALAVKPVFVCGVHRSGTTLLRDLLDGHPDLLVLPSEGTFYTNIEAHLNVLPDDERMGFIGKEWLRRLVNPINQAPYWLLGRSTEEQLPYVDFARYLMAWWHVVDRANPQWPHVAVVLAYATCTHKLSASFWVDKTPVNERYLVRIRQENPQAKIIQMIREPGAVLTSRKLMEPGISLRSALRDIRLSLVTALAESIRAKTDYLLLRYETLCDDPGQTMQQAAAFLSIPFHANLLMPMVAGGPARANSSVMQIKTAGEVHRLNDRLRPVVLSISEQQAAAAYLGPISAKLGYPLQGIRFFPGMYHRFKHRLL